MREYTKDDQALIWLSEIEMGIAVKKKLLDCVESPQQLLFELEALRDQIEAGFGKDRYEQLLVWKQKFDFQKREEQFLEHAVKAVTLCSDFYPEILKEIDIPPVVLYCKGNYKLLTERLFAIVGTRNATRYGKDVTAMFAKELSHSGFTIVSGLARGIDTVAHKTALEEGFATVAVIASGADIVYPPENRELSAWIEQEGLIVTEYPLKKLPQPYSFPERNRIISGLSVGVLATEGDKKSGSLITLNCAVEQNRRAFAVPGNILLKQNAGTNEFLKNLQGAMVTEPNDILKEFQLKERENHPIALQLDIMEQKILEALTREEKHFEELIAFTDIDVASLGTLLTKMEVMGLIKKLPGNYYSI